MRRRLGIPAERHVIGAVGRLNGEKDYPESARRSEAAAGQRPDLYFVIAGKGELEQELRRMAADMGVAERVIFMGHFHDVRKVFEMMDVYVLSSTREGLPNTVLEAMAMEVPIVATDVDGVKEAVTDGREAILVPAQNSERLAAGHRGGARRRRVADAPACAMPGGRSKPSSASPSARARWRTCIAV